MNQKIKNSEVIELYFKELQAWVDGSDSDGSLEFACKNNFKLHAVSMWIGTGATQLNLPVRISRKKEMMEIKQLLAFCDTFTCPDCNHVAFYEKGELDQLDYCRSCLSKNIKKDQKHA